MMVVVRTCGRPAALPGAIGRGAGNGGNSPTSVITGGDENVDAGDDEGVNDGIDGHGGNGDDVDGDDVDGDGVDGGDEYVGGGEGGGDGGEDGGGEDDSGEDDGGDEYGGGEYGGGGGDDVGLSHPLPRNSSSPIPKPSTMTEDLLGLGWD